MLTGGFFCRCFVVRMQWSGSVGRGPRSRPQAGQRLPSPHTPAERRAVVVDSGLHNSGATIYYSLDGSTPSASSLHTGAFLVASNQTVKAIATASATRRAALPSQSFAPNIPSGTLVWSDEFSNSTSATRSPIPLVWTRHRTDCCGNNELETYCAWGSATSPCTRRARCVLAPTAAHRGAAAHGRDSVLPRRPG